MGIAERALTSLIGRPISLPHTLLSRYPELSGARWREGGLPPRVGGWFLSVKSVAGLTLWRTIWLAPGTHLDPLLLLHELRHVQQFQGNPAFPLLYIWESVTRGYGRNRFEADARQFAAQRLRNPAPPDLPQDANT